MQSFDLETEAVDQGEFPWDIAFDHDSKLEILPKYRTSCVLELLNFGRMKTLGTSKLCRRKKFSENHRRFNWFRYLSCVPAASPCIPTVSECIDGS